MADIIVSLYLVIFVLFFNCTNKYISECTDCYVRGIVLAARIQAIWGILQLVLQYSAGININQILFVDILHSTNTRDWIMGFISGNSWNMRITGLNFENSMFALVVCLGAVLEKKRIRYIIQVFTSVNGRIVGVVPSYFMFQVYSEMYERNFVKVPYKEDLSMDVNDIIREMTDDTQLLILLNPNNPMGNVYSDDEFESIMKIAREKQITVLVDEAYHYFYPKTFIKYALTKDHVFITRTFSKLFSMAGCRLGYVVGWADGVKMVQKMCTPHNTNAFAMLFAEKVLTTPGMLDSLITKFNGGRKYLVDSLDKNGYRHKGEAGNFIFIEPKTDAQTVVDRMKAEKKILIKAYPNVGEFGNCLRVSIGEEKYMKQFMDALLEIDQ